VEAPLLEQSQRFPAIGRFPQIETYRFQELVKQQAAVRVIKGERPTSVTPMPLPSNACFFKVRGSTVGQRQHQIQ
jgi:hypothetical protein